ncbi:efflux RND transporter periplasmic adaptor subunit [Paenibacillus aurantius]|uniref:Efflux RND transporter periplasmic adaptor subunit n=1 Tax=Paenibacillus aurantius TaxID=2918900 RepID=A0AA96REK4_9BACL|nr:efflux RND transporter periplasmic adaptor subunit [Paenibacillus aurantius]WNQ10288.1 efflux RND transporter periplasmic adaptor subunit [Paenibacillus aurantius]
MEELWKRLKPVRAVWIAVCGGTVLLAGCSLLPQEEAPLAPPLVKPVKESMDLYEVKPGTIVKSVSGVATFASQQIQYLFFRDSGGRLQSVDVNLGDTIKRGTTVAKLERGDLETKIKLQRLAVEKAQIALEQTRQDKSGDSAAIRLKQIDVETVQIQLNQLTEQLNKANLVSDIEGVVTYIDSIKQGDVVTAYKPVVTVADPKQMKLVYEFSNPNDLTGIQVGMEVELKIASKPYKGKIVQTPSSVPPTTDKAQAEKNAKTIVIVPDELPDKVALGSTADFVVTTEKKENVLVIPRAGLRSYLGREYVQVLEGESRKEVDVEKGLASSTQVEIRKGLKEGQKVILNN